MAFLISTFYLLYFPSYQGVPNLHQGVICPLDAPQQSNFCTQSEYFTISNCVFNFNILALVVSEILGGPKFTLGGPVPPVCRSGKKFVPEASTLLCLMTYLISTFQLLYFPRYQGVPNLHQGALRLPEAPQRKNFDMRTSTCLYLCNGKFLASQLHQRGTNGALSL